MVNRVFERFEDRWDWRRLSENEALPWSIALIERFEDRWDWEKLSRNQALPWSIALIERFETRWEWDFGAFLESSLTLVNRVNRTF
ncbi:hypothetical protein INT80_11955 [Gallibacterium anatis]|uniref:Uncharacterized protein n=1 Tax=Gallibacterium anatis TaxID=750 RepID=A0A930UUF2_9PAST|nr:hypothetical protein [Gallibacterium anatis]